MTGNLTSSCPPSSRWYAVNVTGVAGALFATLPLPLAGNTEGHEEDNGGSNNDKSNDNNDNDDSNENSNDYNDNEEDNDNSGDGDGNSDGGGKYFFGGDSFLINKF
jgi:hypothetical protein